jgi:adenine specific DNA methylase Mod
LFDCGFAALDCSISFLRDDGVFFVQIDDKEVAPLRMMCDEIFGSSQFLNMIVVKTSDPSGHKTVIKELLNAGLVVSDEKLNKSNCLRRSDRSPRIGL